ncbi:hypothetical protein AAY473_013550 [Plecturocebus cupreus]
MEVRSGCCQLPASPALLEDAVSLGETKRASPDLFCKLPGFLKSCQGPQDIFIEICEDLTPHISHGRPREEQHSRVSVLCLFREESLEEWLQPALNANLCQEGSWAATWEPEAGELLEPRRRRLRFMKPQPNPCTRWVQEELNLLVRGQRGAPRVPGPEAKRAAGTAASGADQAGCPPPSPGALGQRGTPGPPSWSRAADGTGAPAGTLPGPPDPGASFRPDACQGRVGSRDSSGGRGNVYRGAEPVSAREGPSRTPRPRRLASHRPGPLPAARRRGGAADQGGPPAPHLGALGEHARVVPRRGAAVVVHEEGPAGLRVDLDLPAGGQGVAVTVARRHLHHGRVGGGAHAGQGLGSARSGCRRGAGAESGLRAPSLWPGRRRGPLSAADVSGKPAPGTFMN